MKGSARAARRAVEALGTRGKTTRIPDEVRVVVLDYAREARSSGHSWSEISETVGLSGSLLRRLDCGGQRPVRLKPVAIVDAAPSAGPSNLVLTTAHGERLEGLGIEDAIQILRGLR